MVKITALLSIGPSGAARVAMMKAKESFGCSLTRVMSAWSPGNYHSTGEDNLHSNLYFLALLTYIYLRTGKGLG